MSVYLQPSVARSSLEAGIAFRQRSEKVLHPVAYALAVRIRFIGVALVSIAQTVHHFALWLILSVVSVVTLRSFDRVEKWTDRTQSLCGASMVAIALAVASVFDTTAAERLSNSIVARADAAFSQLCEAFSHTFDETVHQLRINRELLAHTRHEPLEPRFFDDAVKMRRFTQQKLKKECIAQFPTDPTSKYDAFVISREKMRQFLVELRTDLEQKPFSRAEVDAYYVNKTLEIADSVLEELYYYPKQLLVRRLKEWGHKGWDSESFQEQCLKLFHRDRIETSVEHLVDHVKAAKAKEKAFNRFVSDINALVRREKMQIERVENPSLLQRIWWEAEARFMIEA